MAKDPKEVDKVPSISNPQAVKFANEKARRLADAIATVDRTLQQFALDVVTDFESNTGAAQDGDLIEDGSALDGRRPVTKANVGQLKFVCEQIGGIMNTADYRALVNNWVVNGQPIF